MTKQTLYRIILTEERADIIKSALAFYHQKITNDSKAKCPHCEIGQCRTAHMSKERAGRIRKEIVAMHLELNTLTMGER